MEDCCTEQMAGDKGRQMVWKKVCCSMEDCWAERTAGE